MYSDIGYVNKEHTVLPATRKCINKWNKPLLSDRRTSPYFNRYLFLVAHGVED